VDTEVVSTGSEEDSVQKIKLIVLALIMLFANTLSAHAHGGGHVGIGVVIGPGWWGPYPYYPYYAYPYYPQPPVIVQPQPDAYVQPAPQAEEPQYWYFCPDPQGYYPYVQKCPKGWIKVVPPQSPPDGEE
jgi:hypothetical protein